VTQLADARTIAPVTAVQNRFGLGHRPGAANPRWRLPLSLATSKPRRTRQRPQREVVPRRARKSL